MCLFLCSCSTQTPYVYFERGAIYNDCLIQAANCQVNALKQGAEWAQILIIKFEQFDKRQGHAMCVFKKNGKLYAFDKRGYYLLFTDKEDAESITNEIFQRGIIRGELNVCYYE